MCVLDRFNLFNCIKKTNENYTSELARKRMLSKSKMSPILKQRWDLVGKQQTNKNHFHWKNNFPGCEELATEC